jgi:hypothetical protein
VVSYTLPASCGASGEDYHTSNSTSVYNSSVYLDDGAYTLRALGAYNPSRDQFRFTWAACGITDGGAMEQVTFTLANGTCWPGITRASKDDTVWRPLSVAL